MDTWQIVSVCIQLTRYRAASARLVIKLCCGVLACRSVICHATESCVILTADIGSTVQAGLLAHCNVLSPRHTSCTEDVMARQKPVRMQTAYQVQDRKCLV